MQYFVSTCLTWIFAHISDQILAGSNLRIISHEGGEIPELNLTHCRMRAPWKKFEQLHDQHLILAPSMIIQHLPQFPHNILQFVAAPAFPCDGRSLPPPSAHAPSHFCLQRSPADPTLCEVFIPSHASKPLYPLQRAELEGGEIPDSFGVT